MSQSSLKREVTAMRIKGPRPFVTLRSYTHRGRQILWRARQNRKGLSPHERALAITKIPFWQLRQYNCLIGLVFAVGSVFFMIGAALSLVPDSWALEPSSVAIGIVFFLGSIPFTAAGFMQHFQSANAPDFQIDPDDVAIPKRVSFIGWKPQSPGWLSTFSQLLGTVAFNFNTFDAIHPVSEWYMQDVTIWAPGLIGSGLFLVSGHLAFIETCHGYWACPSSELLGQLAA